MKAIDNQNSYNLGYQRGLVNSKPLTAKDKSYWQGFRRARQEKKILSLDTPLGV